VIRIANAFDRARWNGYVERHPHASVYHRWEWLDVIERTYGLDVHPLIAIYEGRVAGVLPLVRMRRFTGRAARLVSLPYFGHAGALSDDDATWRALLDAAEAERARVGAHHVELRHGHPTPQTKLSARHDKVLMRLDLRAGEVSLFKSLGAKTRADIRRPEKEGMHAEVGGVELVSAFHRVYSDVMRDLGSPGHHETLFDAAARAMPDRTFVVLVRYQGEPVAGAFLVGMGATVEVPCAGALHHLARLRGNMLLYWTALCEAMRRGYSTFSFGRSSEDSGTYTFKKNWGAVPSPLPYHYLLGAGATLPGVAGDNLSMRRASELWQRLPRTVTRAVGPRLLRYLP
jgi:FemAB-related protein (PEP-CTERM system-associated)